MTLRAARAPRSAHTLGASRWWLLLALLVPLCAPAVRAQHGELDEHLEHAAESAEHPMAAPHADETGHVPEHAGEGAHEPESELAVEHGSWFYPIAKWVNATLLGGAKLLTGYIIVAWIIIGLLTLMAVKGTAAIRAGDPSAQDPTGLQNFVEFVVEGMRTFAESVIGPHGTKYAPLIGTFFIFILCNNWIAIIPGFVAPTSTLNMTLALGITAFGCVQYFAIRENGFVGYLLHFAGSPKDFVGWILAPLMFVLEFIGELVKPLSLSMRLFGNIFGEDTVVIQIALFTLGVGGWKIVHGHVEESGSWLVGFIPLHLPMMAFTLFGGLIQALVFTMLTCIYISLLTSHDEGHDHAEEAGHH